MSTVDPHRPPNQYNPAEDGVTHINVYSKAQTHLGRTLTNLAECHIDHPYFGHFRTLEGLWYYMKTGFCEDTFRVLKGSAAKAQGKKIPTSYYPPFNKMFKLGMLEKLDRNPQLQQDLLANELPLTHYYVYANNVYVQDRHQWQLDFWMLLRTTLKSTGSLDLIRNELEEELREQLRDKVDVPVDE